MATERKKLIWVFVVLGIIILAVLAYVYRDKLFGAKCDPNRNGFDIKGSPNSKCKVEDPRATNTPPPPPYTQWTSDSTFPIRKGSWGPKVKALQSALGVTDDGKFGSQTEAALYAKTQKKEVSTQAEYDSIVNPSTSGSVGGSVAVGDALGKSVYAKDQVVHIRSTPNVNDGIINNRICNLQLNQNPAPTVVDKVVGSSDSTYNWYKIKNVDKNQCDQYVYGYVREDVVVLK